MGHVSNVENDVPEIFDYKRLQSKLVDFNYLDNELDFLLACIDKKGRKFC